MSTTADKKPYRKAEPTVEVRMQSTFKKTGKKKIKGTSSILGKASTGKIPERNARMTLCLKSLFNIGCITIEEFSEFFSRDRFSNSFKKKG